MASYIDLIGPGRSLYVGTGNANGCEVWSYNSGAWTQRVGSEPSAAVGPGFGDAGNYDACAMTVHGFIEQLYIGTANDVGCQVWNHDPILPPHWFGVASNGFGDPYNWRAGSMAVYDDGGGSRVFVGAGNDFAGCSVWLYDLGMSWTRVGEGGFGSAGNREASAMGVRGVSLFVGTSNPGGCELWETAGSGGTPYTDWGLTNARGFAPRRSVEVASLAVHADTLYAGTEDEGAGCGVWRHDGGAWTQVNAGGFGDGDNIRASSMASDGTYLYTGTENEVDGCGVWRFDSGAWVKSSIDGFGDVRNRAAPAMVVLESRLYVGTENRGGGCEVWRCDDPVWVRTASAGFGDVSNAAVASMAVMDGILYAGTRNTGGGEVWRCREGVWSQVNIGGFGNVDNDAVSSLAACGGFLYAGTDNWRNGGEVWRYDGASWERVSSGGFGDIRNESVVSMAALGSVLCAGTWNSHSGCEVWCGDAGWKIEGTGGFGDGNNKTAACMLTMGSFLIVGTRNEVSGCGVWRGDIQLPQPTPTPTAIPPLSIEVGPVKAGERFVFTVSLSQNINEAFDFYVLADTRYGPYTLYFSGRVERGIGPLYKRVPGFLAPFVMTVQPEAAVPPGMAGDDVTFYTGVIMAGRVPPVARLSDLTSDTPNVIALGTKTVTVEP
jgi:hypothetical protein